MSQLKKGAILSFVTIFLTNGIGLLITPFIIRKLGLSEYGLYTLIGSFVATISVLDFGLSNTIVRFVAKYRARGDRRSEENFLATTMLIYFAISSIMIIGGIAMYFNLELIFNKLTPVELGKAKVMFIILIFNLAISLPGGAFAAVSSAYEHFVFPRVVTIVRYILRSGVVFALLSYGGDSITIVTIDTVMNVLLIATTGYFVIKKLHVKFKLHQFEIPLVKEIFSFSIWIFIFAMVGQFQWSGGQIVLGILSGPKPVGIYGVGIMLGTYYGAFSTAISGVFLPRATKMTVLEASRDELTAMMIRIGRFSFLILLLIFGGFLLFGKQFVHLWVGDDYSSAWYVAIIIMVSYTLPLVQSFANSMLEARSKFSFKAVIYISLIVIGTGVGAYLIRYFGVIGLISGASAGWVLSQIIMNFYYNKVMDLDIPRFFRELLSRLFPTFIVILALGYTLNFIPGHNWANLVLKIAGFLAIFSVLMYKFGMNDSEIAIFKNMMPSFLRKK